MSYRRSLLVLVIFLVVSAVLSWTVVVTLERGVAGSTTKYSALFTDVSGLRVGDDVRVAGVRVGRVESIGLTGATARVGFRVQSDQVLYGDSTVAVTYQNLIGQRYLGIARSGKGDLGALRSGALIPIERTEPSFDISKLLNGFEPLFGTLDRDAVDNISGALIKALQGDNGAITTLIAETTQLAQTFAGPDEVLGQVITNLTTIVDNLAKQSGSLTTVIQQTRTLFEGLDANRQALFDGVDQIARVVGRASEIIAADRPALGEFINRDPGFTRHFIDNKDKFEYMGDNLPMLLKGMARMTQDGAYVEAYACDVQLSLTPGLGPLIPEVVDGITPGGVAQHTSKCR
ncbi:MCE family protein [Nocardia sp. alder85J]|uniref:MCE family protein n=1 Tax=Nocardia sp. alder85J TaxID=2862949 RepID=UPI001CD7E48A|nr:MCE family protein [Nocardia sp. alder85J]MCX4095212.1 MCE family protein [Nocardia sp. alder85J]